MSMCISMCMVHERHLEVLARVRLDVGEAVAQRALELGQSRAEDALLLLDRPQHQHRASELRLLLREGDAHATQHVRHLRVVHVDALLPE